MPVEDGYPFQSPGGQFSRKVGSVLALGGAGTTLTPTSMIHHVSGTSAALATITVPYEGFSGPVYFIADAVFAWVATGNIAVVPAAALVVNRAYGFIYDPATAKWYPIQAG